MRIQACLLFALLLGVSLNLHAQDGARSINVTTEGQVEVPADLIRFRITVNARADTPRKAYELHKQRENRLVELLRRFEVAEGGIRYQPVSITRYSNRGDNDAPPIETRQQVTLTLRDSEAYERIQVGLIEADFDQFGGEFASSRLDSARDEALGKAVDTAREKARLIAGRAGLELGQIMEINYGETQLTPRHEMARMSADAPAGGGLDRYAQSVVVTASVSVSFAIGR